MERELTESPLVTIAIPTFNRASSYLPRALRASCSQSYPNLDILVADNASVDDTPDVVRSVRDHRIRYHRHADNIGSARNTSFCIDSARGEYTLLLNDDDLIDETFVAACIGALSRGERPGLIRTGLRIIDESGAKLRSHPNMVAGMSFTEFVIAWTEGLTAPYLCSTLFRTDALQRVGMHSRHYMWDDVITELKIAATEGRVDIADVHASSREHGEELTRAATARAWCEDSVELLELVCLLAPGDAVMLRSYLAPFLAKIGYRRTVEMNAPILARLYGGWDVYRSLGVLPEMPVWLKQVMGREPWYRHLIRFKGFGRRMVGR